MRVTAGETVADPTIPARSGARSAQCKPQWQQAVVVEVLDEACDAVTLRLKLADGTGFVAGQYYNVRLAIPGHARPIQRAYSVGSAPLPDPSIIDLGIRELPGGLVSPRLVRRLGCDEHIEVRGPYGRFTWSDDPGSALLVGAGSGLVPLMSMVRFARLTGRTERLWLVCSAVTYAHAFYRDELATLAESEPWLSVAHCITRDLTDPRAEYHHRIDAHVLAEVLAGNQPTRAYVCGPPTMVETVSTLLADCGLDTADVHTEKYD